MSSTNKTTNLQLSQFVGTDKPTWLTDYNGDMQKIDSGFREIKEANAATQMELDGVKESIGLSDTEVEGIKEEIQELKDNDNATGEKLITLGQNYETMHHEFVLIEQTVNENKQHISGHATATIVNFEQPDVPNKSVADYTCVKEIELANGFYLVNAVFNTPKNTDAGKVIGFGISKTGSDFGSGRFMYTRDVTKSEGQTFLSLTTFVNVTEGKIWYNVENNTDNVLEVYGGVTFMRLY